MGIKELQQELNNFNPDLEILLPANNGHVDTYCLLDHGFVMNPYVDLFGTPGKVDRRLTDKDYLYLGSEFPYKHGIGRDNINTPICLLNDDPDYVWKQNDFQWCPEINTWKKIISYNKKIFYQKNTDFLDIINWDKNKHLHLKHPGIEDLCDGIRLCDINYTIIA